MQNDHETTLQLDKSSISIFQKTAPWRGLHDEDVEAFIKLFAVNIRHGCCATQASALNAFWVLY